MLHYAEFDTGNCTVVEADTKNEARKKASDPRQRLTLLRPATAEDVEWFTGSSGVIR